MTVRELIDKLELVKDEDTVVVYKDVDGGWTNIDFSIVTATIYPGTNREK